MTFSTATPVYISWAAVYFARSRLMCSFRIYFVTLAAITMGAAHCRAQEVAFIDVTSLVRKELRRPTATPDTRHQGGIIAHYPCLGAINDSGALHTELVSVDRPRYRAGDLMTFEATVKNVGSGPLIIPTSSELADLQSDDPANQFSYSELDLFLWDAVSDKSSLGLVGVRLYGDKNHANTTIDLRPGEWVRIRGRDRINIPRDDSVVERIHSGAIDHSYPQAAVYHCETLMTATSLATSCREVCIRQTYGKSLPIAVTAPEK